VDEDKSLGVDGQVVPVLNWTHYWRIWWQRMCNSTH